MVVGIGVPPIGMSPHLPDHAMENQSSCPSGHITECSTRKMSSEGVAVSSTSSIGSSSIGVGGGSGILLDAEDRSSTSPSLPSLFGLPLRIRSASLPALIELCIMCFDDEGSVLESAVNYPNIFFLMHKWFTTSESLANDLWQLFESGKPSYHGDYLSLLATIQQSARTDANGSQEIGPSSRPPSVILSRKQDDYNGNLGLRSPSLMRTSNGRSNSVLIPRPACIGAEDDNYFSYHYSKLSAMACEGVDMSNPSMEKSSSTDKNQVDPRPSETCPAGSQCKHDRLASCQIYKFRRSVCYAVRFWIRQFPVHFDLDAKLSSLIKDWQRWLTADDRSNYAELAPLVDLGCLPSYDWIRNISVRDPSVKHCRKVSLVFNHLEPSELAKHLTYLEHRIMRRISFQDYKQYAVTGSLNDNPRLERSVNLFNGLTQWVQCMVLSRSTPQQRAEVIVKLIDVTKKLKELRNFNSLMAVVGGLSHSSLARLTRTSSRVPADSQRTLAELTEFLSSSSNFSNYRRALQECKGFKIPILGVHMKDLISLHVALSDSLEGGLINFRKMAQLSLIFQELQELQNATPPPGANIDLVNTLRVSLELAYTEDEIYELSLAREPRDSLSPQSSPTRPLLLGEWPTAGQTNQMQTSLTPSTAGSLVPHETSRSSSLSSPQTISLPLPTESQSLRLNSAGSDHEQEGSSGGFGTAERKKTLEERMNEMVDAVFGQPKHELLKLIQRSPPSSGAVPSCVTSDELTLQQQPQQPSSAVIEIDSQSRHDFQETNSFRPCTCAHCNGLLWGPLRQGYKCRECGLTAHKMCKDVMTVTCRPKSLITSPFTEAFQSGSGRTRFRRRKKLNSHSDVDSLESGLLAMDCSCDLSCQSPCSRRSSMSMLHHQQGSCDSTDFHHQDRLSDKSDKSALLGGGPLVSVGSGGGSETSTPVTSRSQFFRSPKRRSLIATSNSAAGPVAASSPMPIRQRKSSLSFTSPCRSFPGTDPSIEGQSSLALRSSLSASPRRKISDTLHFLGSPSSSSHKSSSPCQCHGHHS
ncbi:uncharacterized protein LOC124191985 isoform X2 [Daphnia pulex]|uniref:uncharacterized protein LOC124191985 isoform X2 n=1 Tax=Daphnia pulex TaxID=6669 RepID=UPI001EDC955A|nr:uncharacterized protein LOC124191985 isoform X2 [Daphnia pulex]XP_046441030.1 uncharacterized protein LOC124191985 isoform X2 [Daphnia pulex]XP_046441031.1 uncharacterized protein LOC124191985 isoform X2 [Daphnia pulex]